MKTYKLIIFAAILFFAQASFSQSPYLTKVYRGIDNAQKELKYSDDVKEGLKEAFTTMQKTNIKTNKDESLSDDEKKEIKNGTFATWRKTALGLGLSIPDFKKLRGFIGESVKKDI